MNDILNHFKKNDVILYSYIRKIRNLEPIKRDTPNNYFYRLCREIIGQQLSDKSSEAILSRFNKLFSNRHARPSDVISLSHETLRATGMSHAKARYVRNLAEAVVHGNLHINRLDAMTNEEVIIELTKVKGIGPWTSEMFLMFVLGREDVFSYGDLGLRKGMKKIYGFKKDPTKKQIENIISRWSPYKTYASRILWMSLEV
ncbi:DNA-3-methyladenine glycosylase 2 family protein [Candidatus Microgenomates bacterium]|nr:DNA-3-methyladenine glycosylase 2 family protein [Candidatus Microgenomates bacterium]